MAKALVFFFLGLVSACSVVDVRDTVTYEHDNKRVPEEIVEQIIAGKTTKKWILEYVGKPDARSVHKNGSEIFTYRFSEYKKHRVRVLLLFKYEDVGQKEKHIYIQFVDDKVQKLWRDYTLPTIAEDMHEYYVIDTIEDEPLEEDVVIKSSKLKGKKRVYRKVPVVESDVSNSPPPADNQKMKLPSWWPFS